VLPKRRMHEKEQRLRQHQERDRARHTAQSIEKREARLDRLRAANNLYCVMADWCGVTSCT